MLFTGGICRESHTVLLWVESAGSMTCRYGKRSRDLGKVAGMLPAPTAVAFTEQSRRGKGKADIMSLPSKFCHPTALFSTDTMKEQ